MHNHGEEWDIAGAIKPFFLTFSFILVSLVFLSSPSCCNRFVALSCVSFLAGAAFLNSEQLFPDSYAEEIYLRFIIIYLAYFSFLSINFGIKQDDRFSLHNALQNPPSTPWLRGYKLLFNSRGIGTSWELPYLWDSFRHSKPSEKPRTVKPKETKKTTSVPWGKWSSIAVRCGYLALNFFILCLYYEYLDLAIHLRVGTSDFAPEKESIVRRALRQYTGHTHGNPITRRELVVRIWTVFDLIIPDYLILSAYHDFFAIMFIATGLDDFWEWPPLFGPISEAYTVRRYWSIFWHRLIYKTFNAHASRILSIFGQRKRTLTSRLLQNFLVFAFSAVMHGAVSWKLGAQCAFDRHLLFWLLQPVPFVIEGLVASFWKRWRLYLLQIFSTSTIAAFERLVGYVWVFAWFFWCAPKGRLPMLSCGRK